MFSQLPTDIRSGEENKKKYRVPNIKMLERKKIWKCLNSFLKYIKVPHAKCQDPSGPLFFFDLGWILVVGLASLWLDQAHANNFSFFCFSQRSYKFPKIIEKSESIPNTNLYLYLILKETKFCHFFVNTGSVSMLTRVYVNLFSVFVGRRLGVEKRIERNTSSRCKDARKKEKVGALIVFKIYQDS